MPALQAFAPTERNADMGKLAILGLAVLVCLGIFMARWFGKDSRKVEFREVALPDRVDLFGVN